MSKIEKARGSFCKGGVENGVSLDDALNTEIFMENAAA
jgi:hypothetical protein